MDKMPLMHMVAAIAAGIYGVVSIVGGIYGYVKADSKISLIAGGIAGLLLLACACGVFRWPVWSLVGAIIVALLLAVRFAPKIFAAGDSGPAAIAYVMSIGSLIVVVLSGLALMAEQKPPTP